MSSATIQQDNSTASINEHRQALCDIANIVSNLGFVGQSIVQELNAAAQLVKKYGIIDSDVALYIPDTKKSPLLAAGIILQLANALDSGTSATGIRQSQGKDASSLLNLIYQPTKTLDYRMVIETIEKTPLPEFMAKGPTNNILEKIQKFSEAQGTTNASLRNTAAAIILNDLMFKPEPGEGHSAYQIGLQKVEYTWAEHWASMNSGALTNLPSVRDEESYIRLVGAVMPNYENSSVDYVLDYACPIPQHKFAQRGTSEDSTLAFGRRLDDVFSLNSEETFLRVLNEISARQEACSDLPTRKFIDAEAALRLALVELRTPSTLSEGMVTMRKLGVMVEELEHAAYACGTNLLFSVFDKTVVTPPTHYDSERFMSNLKRDFGILPKNEADQFTNSQHPNLTIRQSSDGAITYSARENHSAIEVDLNGEDRGYNRLLMLIKLTELFADTYGRNWIKDSLRD